MVQRDDLLKVNSEAELDEDVDMPYYEAKTKTIHALKSTLNDEYLFKVSNFDSAFIVWNPIVSLGE